MGGTRTQYCEYLSNRYKFNAPVSFYFYKDELKKKTRQKYSIISSAIPYSPNN